MKKQILLILFLFPLLLIALEPYVDFLPEPQIKFQPKNYICYKTNSPIIIDGKMDEKIWQKANWTDDFIDIEGEHKPKPEFKTNVKMLWDDDYFYFFCEMQEPHIWANFKQRDSVIFYDNDFEIFIDPDGDTHNYYEFEMNAFNTVWDLFLSQPYRDSNCKVLDSWDIQGLKTAVNINGTINDPADEDISWSVEIAYPWKVLEECATECPPKQNDQWRVNFSRVEWDTKIIDNKYSKLRKPEHNWVWSPQGIINMHYPEMWGFVQFSEKFAGSEEDKFIMNEDENIKWILRQIYYKERTYKMQNGKFTDELSLLNIKIPEELFPKIIITPNYFEVVIKVEDKEFYISSEGRTW
ncbi:MAG: carbohydrate-binding family 9-like protein [Flavobacteriaceae bacterium]|nr:carbohydrate-binding family 9-like protein [Flavobacteriaceae bacterium]